MNMCDVVVDFEYGVYFVNIDFVIELFDFFLND